MMEGGCMVTQDSKRRVRDRLRETGVVCDNIECFFLTDDPELEGWRQAFDIGAYLGATSVAVVNLSLTNTEQAATALALFAREALEFGLVPSLEPISMGATRTLEEAALLVRQSGSANVRIAVDVLHVMRSGGSLDPLGTLDPSLVGYAQICDGPATIADEEIGEEAGYNRMAPGEGDFPLAEFVSALPPDTVIGVEVPMRGLRERGVSPRDRAALAMSATRLIQERASNLNSRGQ
jgi:sugar phosphate isomerase/epimerase